MPRLIDTRTRTGTVVDATVRILAVEGVAGLTLRGIARESRVSTGSLLHHFESRRHILELAAHRTGSSLLAEIESDAIWHGVPAFLPGTDETQVLTRAWLGWCELWRSEESLADIVGEIRRQELSMLAEAHEHRLSRSDLDSLSALVEGLRHAICAPVRPLERSRARELLAAASAAALEGSA